MFKKIKFHTHENVGSGDLTMPELEMHTCGFWFSFPDDITEMIQMDRSSLGGALRGLANLLGKMAPLWVMCDSRDLRAISQVRSPFSEKPTVFIWENIPGGVGLSDKIYSESERLFSTCLDHVSRCKCSAGCPVCVGPAMEVGDSGKQGVIKLLEHALAIKWDQIETE